MFAEKTMESSTITGLVDYQLGTPVGAFQAWRSSFATGSAVFYYAENGDGTIWECGYGILTTGAPDTIGRTVTNSSTGAKINWAPTDAPIYVMSVPSAAALRHLITGGRATTRPGWLQKGGTWLDESDANAWSTTRAIDKLYNATKDIEKGRVESWAGIYVSSPRRPTLSVGAANLPVTTDHIGWRFTFDTSAASRAIVLPAIATVDTGFEIEARGLSAANGVVVTPNGTEVVDFGAGGATLTVPGRVPFKIWSDGNQWRTSYVAAATPIFGFANKFRNGNMVAWPAGGIGSSFNVANGATGAAAIGAGGWGVFPTGAPVAVQQSATGANGASQSMQITGATSVSGLLIGQRIEASDAAPLAGQQVTVQAAITNNTGASITPNIQTRYPGAADDWTTPVGDLGSTALQPCANGATTIVAYTFPVSANAIRGYEVRLDFGNNFSSNAKSIKVTALDIRVTTGVATGLNATPPVPEFRDVAEEIARGDRFFQTSYDNGVLPGTATAAGIVNVGNNGSGTNNAIGFNFRARMRAVPTLSFWDHGGNAGKSSKYQGGAWTDIAGTLSTLATSQTGWLGFTSDGTGINNYSHYQGYADFW